MIEKEKNENVLKEASANSAIDQKKLDKKTLEIIKQALECKDTSFFRKICELVMEERNYERTKNK